MTYRQAKARLDKCREEIQKLNRKIQVQEMELEGLVKLTELLQRYEEPDTDSREMSEMVESAISADGGTALGGHLETAATVEEKEGANG